MTRTRKIKPENGPQGPRFSQFRCPGKTPDGVVVTRDAMKVRIYVNGVVMLFKGHSSDGKKGALAGIFNNPVELAALELAARQARIELLKSPTKTMRGADHG